jgi:ABC-type transporter Mla subunit MlaD
MPTLKDRMDRVEAALDRTTANLDRLSQVVNTLAASVVSHEQQIEQLVREWQAYLRTIHPRQ